MVEFHGTTSLDIWRSRSPWPATSSKAVFQAQRWILVLKHHGHGSWKQRGLDRTRVRDDQKTSINGLSHDILQSPAGQLNSSAGRLNSSYFPRLSRVSEQSSCHNSIIVMKWFALSYSLLIMLLTDVQNYFEMDHSWYILGTVLFHSSPRSSFMAGHLMSALPGTQWDLWAKMNQNDGRSTWEGLLGIGIVIHCKNHCWTCHDLVFCMCACAACPTMNIPCQMFLQNCVHQCVRLRAVLFGCCDSLQSLVVQSLLWKNSRVEHSADSHPWHTPPSA